MARLVVRPLTDVRSTRLRTQYPRKNHRFTEGERKRFLDRMTLHEVAVLPMTVLNYKLLTSTRTWLRTRFPTLALVSRMYVEHEHVVCWLESR